ncbi:uncharacterized protein LOC144092880 [Stigmatopora argus]
MSTGDFQNKYASFMEGVVKSTIAETTKLFETLVDELKEELTKVKTENEALKTTCRKMEDVISKWENSKMQNAAVQCELNPGQVLPMKQEAQQPTEKKVFYILLHNPGTATQETSNVAALPSNHPVPQPAVADPQIVYTVTDPPPVQSCEDVTGSQVEQQFLIEDLRSCDDQVTSVSLSLENAHSSQKAQNQSIETIEYIKSPSPVMDHLQMAPCADQRLTPEGTQQLVITHFQLALPSLAKIPVHKPKPSTACGPATDKRRSLEVLQKSQSSRVPHPKPPQVQNMSMETINVLNPLVPPSSYTIAAPNVGPPVPVLKSQPSEMSQIRILIPVPYSAVHKNTKRKQIEAALKKQDGQLIIQTPVLKCATKLGNVQKQPTESVQHPQSTLKQVLWTPSTHANGGPRIETTLPQTIPQPLGIQSKTVLLQDAILLVEAMDQSKARTLQQETVQDRRTVPEAPLPVVRTPTSTQTLTLQSPPADELSTNKASFVTDATKSSDAQFQIGLLPAPQQNPGEGPPEITTGAASQSLETLTIQSPPAIELSTNKASFVTDATKSSDAQFQIGLLPAPQQNPGAGPPEITTGAASQSIETLTLQSPSADELSTNKASFVTDATKSSDAQFQIGLLPAPQQNSGAGPPAITTGAAGQSLETLTLQSPPAVELSTNKAASFVTNATKSSDAQFQIGLLPEPQQNPGAGPPEISTGPSSTDAASQSPETLTLQSPPAVELSTNKASFVTNATKSSDAQFQIGLLPEPQQNPGAGPPEIPTGPSSTGAASQSPETLTLQSPPGVELSTNKASFVTDATKSSDAQFQIRVLPEPQQNPGAGPPEIPTGPSSTGAASQSPETLTLQSPPAVELSTNKASFVTDATISSDAQFQIGLLPEPQQNPGAGPPKIMTGSSSTGAASQSLEQLETTPDPEPVPSKNIVFNKPQPSHPQFKFCPLSSNQISEVVSTVAASQSDCTSLASLPQREKDVSTRPSPPLVTSDPTNQSSDQGSCKKIKIIIRKAANAVVRPAQVSETQADLTPSPVPPVTAPSQVSEAQVDLTPSSGSPVTTPSQEQNTNASDEKQTAPSQEQNTNDTDEKQTAPSQEQNTNAPDEKQTVPSPEQMPSDSPTPSCQQLESSSEELAVREIIPEEMPAVLETENVPGDGSPLVPVIRLKRLASLAFSAESSLQSQEKVSPSVPPEGPPSTPSSISDPDSETSPFPTEGSPSWSTGGQLILEETSDDSLLPEKPEPCFTSEEEETPATTLLESTPPCVSEPVLVETKQSEQQDSPAVPVQQSETSTLGAEMVNEAERDSVPANATSSSPEQLTDLVKDSTPQPEDPQPTKTHFLAQLEISPVLDEAQMVM